MFQISKELDKFEASYRPLHSQYDCQYIDHLLISIDISKVIHISIRAKEENMLHRIITHYMPNIEIIDRILSELLPFKNPRFSINKYQYISIFNRVIISCRMSKYSRFFAFSNSSKGHNEKYVERIPKSLEGFSESKMAAGTFLYS